MPKKNLQKSARNLSPLSLLVLAACGGEESFGDGQVLGPGSLNNSANGFVNKGPLSNALVYADYDDPTLGNSDSVRTGADGSYTLTTLNNNYTIVAVTDGNTIDTSSGTVLSGVTLKAPSGATVVTPTSTLMEEGGLTAAQVIEVLGLPEGVDPLTFNAFAADVNAADALAVEKASQQIMSVVNAFAAAAEGAGASQSDAFEAALRSVAEVVKTKAANLTDESASDADKTLDLSNATDLALIQTEITTAVATVTGVDAAAFGRVANDTATAVQNVNTKIEAVTDLNSDASKNAFSTTQVLADQVKTASEAEVDTAGSGSIDFKDSAKVDMAASNAAPTAISLSSSAISEAASSLVVGTLSTVDSDQGSGVAFTYAIAEVAGSDYAAFTINQATGELSLKSQPDYETKTSYSVTILSADDGGKTLSKSFKIGVTDANDLPTLENAIVDQTIAEDSALSFQFASDVFADVDASHTFTYTATLSDGSALPSWLSFDADTRTFSGTPLNGDVGVTAVKVTATDSGNAAITDTFNITVTNTSDAMVTFGLNAALSNGLGPVIDQDISALEEKVSSFYNDPNTGILVIIDSLNSESFGTEDEDISISSNGVAIKNTDGYTLSFEFSNFSPNSLEELSILEENFNGDVLSLSIAGGFEKIALTDPDGDVLIELSHSDTGISWQNLKANDGEIDTFIIEGTFDNQISNYIEVLSEIAATQETDTGAVLQSLGGLLNISGVVAKSGGDEQFSLRLGTDAVGEVIEVSIFGSEAKHEITVGAEGSVEFLNGLVSEAGNIDALLDVFGPYISMEVRFENDDYFYESTELGGSRQNYSFDGVSGEATTEFPSFSGAFINLPVLGDNDIVEYFYGGSGSITKEEYDSRLAKFDNVNNFINSDQNAEQLFGLNLTYEYGGSEVFTAGVNDIDWEQLETLENYSEGVYLDPLSFSNDLKFIGSVGDNNEDITTIINEYDTSEINIVGVKKEDFITKYEESGSHLFTAIEYYTDFLALESDNTYIQSDIA